MEKFRYRKQEQSRQDGIALAQIHPQTNYQHDGFSGYSQQTQCYGHDQRQQAKQTVNGQSMSRGQFHSDQMKHQVESSQFYSDHRENQLERSQFHSDQRENQLERSQFHKDQRENQLERSQFHKDQREQKHEHSQFHNGQREIQLERSQFQNGQRENQLERSQFQNGQRENQLERSQFQNGQRENQLERSQFHKDQRAQQREHSQKKIQQQLLSQEQGIPDLKLQANIREDKKMKQHTDWNGVLQDLFGMDLPQTAESTHESTSSGVASDVTSLYPPTPLMTTFKGGDSADSASSAKSLESRDSGTKSVSLSGSPKPTQPFQKPYSRDTRAHPAVPPPLIPRDASSHYGRNSRCQVSQSPSNGYQVVNSYFPSPLTVPREMTNSRECRPRLPERNCVQCNSSANKSYLHQRNLSTSPSCCDCRTMHPAFCSESDHCCMQDVRDVQLIEALGDSRYTEPHCEDNGFVKDRQRPVTAPVPPSPTHGYCCSQQNHHNNNDHQLIGQTAVRSPKVWYKEQQQDTQNRQSPKVKETSTLTPDMINRHNHRISPSSQARFNELNSSPNLQPVKANGVSRTSRTPCYHQPTRLAHQPKYKPCEQKPDNCNLHSQTPRGAHLLLTQAQVHTPQPEVGAWTESKPRPACLQPESHNNFPGKAQFAREHDSTMYLVTGINHLSLNQMDNHKTKMSQIQSNNKHLMSQAAPFEFLRNDVLLKIFSHLPTDQLCRCSQVCRHWYNVVWDHPILWTSIIINNPNIDIDRALKYLTRRLSYNTPKVCMILEKININACCQLSDRGLQTVAKRCPELRYMDMQNCHLISNVGVKEVVSRCVNLERLDVTGCPLVTRISLTDSLISQSASQHLQRIYLRYLDMTDCPSVTDQDLSVITSQCTQLLFFYLRRCPLITDLGVTYISNNCNSLRELSLSDCKNVTDLGMRELAKLHENLRYLSVAKCEKVSDQGVIHVARNCSKLRYLNVRGCEAFSDTGLEFLARNCPRLRSLDIGKCDITDDGLYALSMYCPNLRKLGVKSCDAITDKGIVLIAYRCPSLQQLHVQDCCLSPDAYAMVRKYCKRAIIEHTNPAIL